MKCKEITLRLATAKNVQVIWDFYLKTNFLYEEKLLSMGDYGAAARETLLQCLELDSDDFRVCMAFDEEAQLRSLCTHALFSDTQGWVMHLASDGDVRAMASSIYACKPLTARSPAKWIAYTFRGNNRSVRKLFTSVNGKLLCETENENYHFFKTGSLDLSSGSRKANCGTIRLADERDRRAMIAKLPTPSERIALYSLGDLDDFRGGELKRRFHIAGLPFERAAWAAELNGELIGLAIGEIRPPWWNMSNLSTGVRLFLSKPEFDQAWQLLNAAATWFDTRNVKNWTILVPPHDVATTSVLNDCGAASTKQYYRITAPSVTADSILEHYKNFTKRKARQTAPIGVSSLSL